MIHECHIVFTLTRNIYTKAITEVTMLNCFETLPQAKASLQYEHDICLHEICDPMDETDRPVWLNNDHTELKLTPGADPSYETIVYIDSSVHFHDATEPLFEYGAETANAPSAHQNFRILDSVCFVYDTGDGNPEVIRGRLCSMNASRNDNKSIIGIIDRMVVESTGIPFGTRHSVPLKDLYHHPEDAFNAYRNGGIQHE